MEKKSPFFIFSRVKGISKINIKYYQNNQLCNNDDLVNINRGNSFKNIFSSSVAVEKSQLADYVMLCHNIALYKIEN